MWPSGNEVIKRLVFIGRRSIWIVTWKVYVSKAKKCCEDGIGLLEKNSRVPLSAIVRAGDNVITC